MTRPTRRPHRRAFKRLALLALALLPGASLAMLHQPEAPVSEQPAATITHVRFAPLDVYIDAGDAQLGAWQVELVPKPEFAGHVSIVGIAGGDTPYQDAPYFDERAIMNERVIIADFETDQAALHTGKSRVAQVQLRIESEEDPDFDITLHTAARHDGAAIKASVEAVLRKPQQGDAEDESTDTQDQDTPESEDEPETNG